MNLFLKLWIFPGRFFFLKKYFFAGLIGSLAGLIVAILCAAFNQNTINPSETSIRIEFGKKLIESEKRYDDALKLLLPIAKEGNLDAIELCLCIYAVKNEIEKGFALEKYAKGENHHAYIYFLGLLYENGFGVEKNEKKAMDCYKYAADRGIAWAQYKYAISLLNNNENSKKEAFLYLKKSAAQNNSMAWYQLGKMFEKEFELESESSKKERYRQNAFECMKVSARERNVFARFDLKLMNSKAGRSNAVADISIVFELADQGLREAQLKVGQFYKDMGYAEKANEWNFKAEKEGLSPSELISKKVIQNTNLSLFF